MRRLLFVTTSYPQQEEGQAAAGLFVKDWIEETFRQGVAVCVVAPGPQNNFSDRNGILEVRYYAPRIPLSLLSPWNPLHAVDILATLKNGLRSVLEAANKFAPEHILALWVLPSGYWAREAARAIGVAYSVWALGSDIWSLAGVPVVRNYLRQVMRDAKFRFADGYQLSEKVEELSGLPCFFLPSTRKLRLVTEKNLRRRPPFRLTFLGRWHHNKGVDLLLKALNLLEQNSWQAIESVGIFGGGPLENKVRQAVKLLAQRGLPIRAGGYLDQHQAAELLGETDFLLLPSRRESIPVIFSDAMRSGCPVIATPVGDLPQLLQKWRVGLLAESVSASAFAIAIKQALKSSPAEFAPDMKLALGCFDLAAAVRFMLTTVFGDRAV